MTLDGNHFCCYHGDLCLGQTIFDSRVFWTSAADAESFTLNHHCWPGWIRQAATGCQKVWKRKKKQKTERKSSLDVDKELKCSKDIKEENCSGFCNIASSLCPCFPVWCHLTELTRRQTQIWRLKKLLCYPAHHDSSPFPFLQPSTLFTIADSNTPPVLLQGDKSLLGS